MPSASPVAPDVDVDVDPGRWPQYDVNWADVEVGTSERMVQVPVIRVEREAREIAVPYIDIDVPGAGRRVVVNVPDDLDTRSVIVGERPDGVENQQHRFVSSGG
jgi:hypothetical protein